MKQYYHEIIQDFNERLLHTNLEYFKDFKIFESSEELKRNYNSFIYVSFKLGENILEQGEIAENVYFIQSGDFDVLFYASLNDIVQKVKKYGGTSHFESVDEYLHGKWYLTARIRI